MKVNPNESQSARIIVAGAGAAGLEAMLALRQIGGDRARVEMYSPREDFELRPLAIFEALKAEEIPRFDLEDLTHSAGAGFVRRSIASVDSANRRVTFHDDHEVEFDYLLVATGTKSLIGVPGAGTFWGPGGGEAFADYRALYRTRTPRRVVLTMPNLSAWPLPIYEIALFLAADIKRTSSSVDLTIVTPEGEPLEIFGESTSHRMTAILDEYEIEFLPGITPVRFQHGSLETASGDFIGADLVVALPALKGRPIDGLPCDGEDFIKVDGFGQVEGLDRVYAAGDATDFPIKFGGLATEQADVAAFSIAARLWGAPEPEPFHAELNGFLLTPDGALPLGEAGGESGGAPGPAARLDPSQKIRGMFLSPFLAEMISAESSP